MNVYHMPGSVLDGGNTIVNKTKSLLSSRGSSHTRGETWTINKHIHLKHSQWWQVLWWKTKQGKEIDIVWSDCFRVVRRSLKWGESWTQSRMRCRSKPYSYLGAILGTVEGGGRWGEHGKGLQWGVFRIRRGPAGWSRERLIKLENIGPFNSL